MKNIRTSPFLAIISVLLAPLGAAAQLGLTTPGVPAVVTFDVTENGVNNDVVDGSGFQPIPTPGRLDSDAWETFGWSDGSLAYGGVQVTPATDFARGQYSVPIAVGGIYAFDGAGISGRALGFQPNNTDFTPGRITLRVQNNTGVPITAFDLSFNAYYRNDQAAATLLNLSYSTDFIDFVQLPSSNLNTPAAATGPGWVQNPMAETVGGVFIQPGDYLYIRWTCNSISGSAPFDELALDDISVTGYAHTALRFSSPGATVAEDAGATAITVEIVNPSGVTPTNVDVVLTSGSAARIDGYTTQSLVFPAGSSTPIVVPITVTDNSFCDGNELLNFDLQNLSGGQGVLAAVPNKNHLLVVNDNEITPSSYQQYFDGTPSDVWPILSGGGAVSSDVGATDFPAFERVLTGPNSIQVVNASVAVEFDAMDVVGWSDIKVRARIAATGSSNTTGLDGNDHVRFFLDIDGAGYPVSPDLEVRGNSNARWGYSTGTGVASATAGVPVVIFPAGGSNRTTDGYSYAEITVPGFASTIGLRMVVQNNASSERWSVDNVEITGSLCSQIYYSRASGSETDPIWSNTRIGTPGPAVFNQYKDAVVQIGHTITTGADWELKNLTVETGGSVVMGTNDLNIYGPLLSNDGSFSITTGAVALLGGVVTSMEGASGFDLFDLTVNGGGGDLQANELLIRNSLDVINGGFNANTTGNPFRRCVLVSDAVGTARLGPVVPPASFTGSIDMERFIPAGVTNWRLISSATNNNTLSSLEDDFLTAGYPGSFDPSFDSPPGSNILWPSIRTYTETDPGANLSDGLVGATSDLMVMAPGQGFAAWAGTSLTTTTAFTIDLRSGARQGPVVLPMTYTNTGAPLVDGWNLVGNPLPSPVDFSLISKGADVSDFYYVFDPVSGNNAVWDEVLGVSIPFGALNGNIQSMQGFWLKATGPAVTTTVEETDKVLDPSGGGLFGGLVNGPAPLFRVKLLSAQNDMFDESLVHFGAGDPNYGTSDIMKFPFSHPDAPQIQTLSADGQDLMLNAFGELTADALIPVSIKVPITGDHTIRIFDAEGIMGYSCLVLEDLFTGASIPLVEGSEYTFTADASTPAVPARFLIHATAAVPQTFTDATCAGANDGHAMVVINGPTPADVTWMDEFGNVIVAQSQVLGAAILPNLAPGDYMVSVSTTGLCGTITNSFTISEPLPLATQHVTSASNCAVSSDGAIDLMVMGGTAPHSFTWSTGASDEDLVNVPAGTYDVDVLDANGCQLNVSGLIVPAGTGPTAEFVPSATDILVGDEVEFFNFSTYGVSYTWDFGDGSISTDNEPLHTFLLPGIFTVTLTVDDGGCLSVFSMDIMVNTSTGITAPKAPSDMHAWYTGQAIVVDWDLTVANTIHVDVLDATGRIVSTGQAQGAFGTLSLSAEGWTSGVYFVRLVSGNTMRTAKLGIIR